MFREGKDFNGRNIFSELNLHGRIQNILAAHLYENTDRFFNRALRVFTVRFEPDPSQVQELGKGGDSVKVLLIRSL